MREDMSRVIVERPRLGGGWTKKGRPVPFSDLPKCQGIRRPHTRSGMWKALNENLNPLRRYLERQVGRPWDKVYSEIAQNLRPDSTVQQHVRDHVRDFVAIKPLSDNRFGGLWYQLLYVDPRDGLLKRTDRLPEARARRRARRRTPETPSRIALAPDRELRRIAGIWYEVTLAPLPKPEYRRVREVRKVPLKAWDSKSPVVEIEVVTGRLATPGVQDVVTGAAVLAGPESDDQRSWAEYRRAFPDARYATAKRALSRSELRRHGLRNAED